MVIGYGTMNIPHSVISSGDDLPAMERALNVQNRTAHDLSEEEGLFLGFGFRDNAYPYSNQSDYGTVIEGDIRTVVLENDWLVATFLPDYGGRLWSLWDKEHSENLLYTNDVLQMRNLAIRNAWFSGGVEWNIASVGHSVFTCAPLYVAEVNHGERNCLRMYEYERLRGICYQMDFWLEGKELLCRMRVENRHDTMVPMYWWSNMAVPEYAGGRVIAPASAAYTNGVGTGISKKAFPLEAGTDMSFYNCIPKAVDYFFDIGDGQRKFEANVSREGTGLLHYSTRRLEGRKLFCWGHNQGAKSWQAFLTDNAGDYIEIQAGLAKTQYECLPMPPNTVWAWLESYSRLSLPPQMVMGDYDKAVAAVEKVVAARYRACDLEALLTATKAMAVSEGRLISAGSGYGYLAGFEGEENLPVHLRFEPSEALGAWQQLLTEGIFRLEVFPFVPRSYMYGDFYKERLEKALTQEGTDRAYALYHLGVMHYDGEDYERAFACLSESLALEDNGYTLFALAYVCERLGALEGSDYALEAIRRMPGHYGLVEKMMKLLLDGGNYGAILSLRDVLRPEAVRDRLKMYFAFAYAHTGMLAEAEALLHSDGGLRPEDIREGEVAISDLWALVHGDEPLPSWFDFRMR